MTKWKLIKFWIKRIITFGWYPHNQHVCSIFYGITGINCFRCKHCDNIMKRLRKRLDEVWGNENN